MNVVIEYFPRFHVENRLVVLVRHRPAWYNGWKEASIVVWRQPNNRGAAHLFASSAANKAIKKSHIISHHQPPKEASQSVSKALVPNNTKHHFAVHGVLATSHIQPTHTTPQDPRALRTSWLDFLHFAMYQQFSAGSSNDYGQMIMSAAAAGPSTVAPHATTTAPQPQPVTPKPQPLVATGNWTTELVQLAKTAELKWVARARASSIWMERDTEN